MASGALLGDGKYGWSDISSIPNLPGIYAWYYLPEITDFDLERTIEVVQKMRSANQLVDARKEIEAFLDKFIFSYFKEDAYTAELRGLLKPVYRGNLEHQPRLSPSMVDRLVEDPKRLITVKQVLESSAPDFASPMYIGMSERLGRRLQRHRNMIEKFRSKRTERPLGTDVQNQSMQQRDQSFAFRVASMQINPQRLFVVIQKINGADNRYVDLENILNRIHYPLLGRN